MQEDNMYIRRSSIENTPPEQEEAEKRERSSVVEQFNIIKEVIDRLDKSAAHYETIMAIPDEVCINPQEFMHVVAANKLTAHSLRAEADYLESLVEQYVKRR